MAEQIRTGFVGGFVSLTPPGLVAGAFSSLRGAAAEPLSLLLGGLVLWTLPAFAVGYFAFARLHEGDSGRTRKVAQAEEKRAARPARGTSRIVETLFLRRLPPAVAAVAVKDWHYFLRSPIGKFLLVVMPTLMIVVGIGVGRELDAPFLGLEPANVSLFGYLLYVPLSMNVFVNNAFAWESRGVQSYFLSPVHLHRVLLGKNLALWSYAAIVAVLCFVAFSLAVGVPDLRVAIDALLLFVAAMLTFTLAGNLTSVAFPAARPVATMRNTLPGASLLVSLLTMLVIALQSGICLALPLVLGLPGLRTPLFAGLVLLLAVAYAFGLRMAADWMDRRREMLVDRLRPVE